MSSESNDKLNSSDSYESDVSSNAEELQMLKKLKIDENLVLSNEKEMQSKINRYEKTIRELQNELNSRGSTSEITNNLVEHQLENNNSDSFGSASSNGNKLKQIQSTNSFISETEKKEIPDKSNLYFQSNYTNNFDVQSDNLNETYLSRLHFINDLEHFVNTKFTEAEMIINSLLYPNSPYDQISPQLLSPSANNLQEIQEENIRLKAQIKQLKQSLRRYLDRHDSAKKKQEESEEQLKQKIAFLEEREKQLTEIISMQQKKS